MKKKVRRAVSAAEANFFRALKVRVEEAWGTPNVLSRTLAPLEEHFGPLAEMQKKKIESQLLYEWAVSLNPEKFLRTVKRKVFKPLLAIQRANHGLS